LDIDDIMDDPKTRRQNVKENFLKIFNFLNKKRLKISINILKKQEYPQLFK